MKNYIVKSFILVFIITCMLPLVCGCETSFPDSALYVGKNKEFLTIQSAIDASVISGQYIVVCDGEYKENLYITKPVKIVGKTNGVTLSGSATISVDGVYFEKIAFSGKNTDEKNGVIISPNVDVTGLNFYHCSFKNYEQCGILSQADTLSPTKFNALNIQHTSFVQNGIAGIKLNNIKSMTLDNCSFEKNGTNGTDTIVGSAINIDLLEGKYSLIEIHSTDFKFNGNNKNERSAAFCCSHKNNSYDGEVVFDDCLFQSNIYDIISGVKDLQNTSIDICVINSRGLKTNVKKLDEEN